MARRSRSREVALQLLVQRDVNPDVPRNAIDRFARDRLRNAELEQFCFALYDGVVTHGAEIDESLTRAAENWRLPRMAVVDRNVLRLGACEVLFADETPPSVAIDEAVELARRFGTANSPAFVNGVLDRVARSKTAGPG